ncbi:YL1 nuclear protein C-terminal domain-containing protein [Syncephalis fuscata]|nr:YL1 nuclear protein C-terminal domain-containing protein [Syncephalis fuscata]
MQYIDPEKSTCVITGLPAKYRDPKTGLPYANLRAFSMLRRLAAGTFPWNNNLGAYTNAADEQAPATLLHLGTKGIKCIITGLPAIGYEPHTGLPYATEEALDTIHQLRQGGYHWMDDQKIYVSYATSNAQAQPRPATTTCSSAIRNATVMAQIKAATQQVEADNLKALDTRSAINKRSIYTEDASDHWSSD